ncbi:MAG: EamA family transporter [Lacunisphaera sp.]
MSTSSSTPSRTALALGFAAIYLIWGSTYLGIRVAVETIPPFLMASGRFLIAGSVLAAWIAFTKGFRPTARQWFDNAIVGALLLLGGNGLVSWSEQRVPSGIATLIISVGPVFVVLLDWLVLVVGKDPARGTRPTGFTFAGLALGFIGLAVLVGPDVLNQGVGHLHGPSVLGLIGACFFWGVGSIYTRYARNPAEPFTAAAMQQLCAFVWLLLVSVLCGEPWHFHPAAVSRHSFFAWVYLVIAGSLVGFTTFVWLMKHSTPAKVSTYAYVNPIVAVFLGWWILKEPVSPRIFLGAAIIIAGVVIITISKNRKARPAVLPPANPIPAAQPVSR